MSGSIRIRERRVPKRDLYVVLGGVPGVLSVAALIILALQGYLSGPLTSPTMELFIGFLFALSATVVGGISVFTGGIKRWLAWTPGLGGFAIMLLASGIQLGWLGWIAFAIGVVAQVGFRKYWNYSLATADGSNNDNQSSPLVNTPPRPDPMPDDGPTFPGYGVKPPTPDQWPPLDGHGNPMATIPEMNPGFVEQYGPQFPVVAGDPDADEDKHKPPQTD